MSNWTIACSDKLDFIYDKLREKLLLSNYIQADETTLKVVDTQGKESRSKTYMWLYKNQSCDNQIILFDYQKTRSSSCPKKFLEGFSGYLQTMDIIKLIMLLVYIVYHTLDESFLKEYSLY